ncbi:putative dynein heavy chain [Trypanosoma rangeli]|uniref:Putative dynein heavy chain n=1 Tax=Trypanosoma rangeli TaxID=5698 RepID=A0A3R7N6K0_TRYRA|nr:putative dynein heavy chain [Trypanosoma rangeli]RNE97375.1 putative dynein heavy chain [Trypanosoma rangeli]|eukprot:RNE97375.1 putative dynein heavy chain [Trypanosoma rangeli]
MPRKRSASLPLLGMGAAKSRPVREAPVRYVARQLPHVDKTPVEQQFKKPEFTAQGINRRLDDVNTEPLMHVERCEQHRADGPPPPGGTLTPTWRWWTTTHRPSYYQR